MHTLTNTEALKQFRKYLTAWLDKEIYISITSTVNSTFFVTGRQISITKNSLSMESRYGTTWLDFSSLSMEEKDTRIISDEAAKFLFTGTGVVARVSFLEPDVLAVPMTEAESMEEFQRWARTFTELFGMAFLTFSNDALSAGGMMAVLSCSADEEKKELHITMYSNIDEELDDAIEKCDDHFSMTFRYTSMKQDGVTEGAPESENGAQFTFTLTDDSKATITFYSII